MAQDIVSKIQAAAQASGVDPGVALRIAGVESSMNPRAKNPKSSAKGLFQVTNDTWKDYGGKPGLQKNTDENIRVGMKILSSNKDSMQKFLGRDPLPSDIYAAHFFGPTGARAVMSGDPLAQVSTLVSKSVMKANPQLAGKTANEVLTGFKQKFDGAAKRYPTSEPMKTTTAVQGPRATQPKMDQEAGAAAPALSARDRVAGMGSNYQAALAAMMLGEAADEGEDDGVAAKEPKEKAYVAPVAKNALADMDFGPSSSPFDAMEPAVTPPGMKFPMQFAEGGDVADPEAALMAGASDAPTPRVGTAAAALAALRGLGEYPYNLVGGGVDLATMAMRPFGYDVEKPVMGSDFLKEQATRFGIRPPEETDPTLRNIRMGTEIVTSVLDPSAGARAVGSALRGAGDLATSEPARVMLERVMKAGGTEPMYAARPPGGFMIQRPGTEMVKFPGLDDSIPMAPGGTARNYDAKDEVGALDKLTNEGIRAVAGATKTPEKVKGVADFLLTKGRDYFSTNFASTNDPIYKDLVEGRILPVSGPGEAIKEYMARAAKRDDEALGDVTKVYDRAVSGYNVMDPTLPDRTLSKARQEMYGRTQASGAKQGLKPEQMTEMTMSETGTYNDAGRAIEMGIPGAMDAAKYNNPVFDLNSYNVPDFLSPKVIAPELLDIPPNELAKMTYPEAVERVNGNLRFKRDFYRIANDVKEGRMSSLNKDGKGAERMFMFTDPVETQSPNKLLSWVRLNDTKGAYMEGKAMDHSVYQYDTYGSYGVGGKEGFDNGFAEIYSLRDKKGMPSVTVELANKANPDGTVTREVMQVKGKFNSRPLADNDIFALFDEINPDNIKTEIYRKNNNGVDLDENITVDWAQEYNKYKTGDVQGFANGGLVERSVYNHQKYL